MCIIFFLFEHLPSRYREVLVFILMELCESKWKSKWQKDMQSALIAAQVDEKFCVRMSLLCPKSSYMGQLLKSVLSQFLRAAKSMLYFSFPDCVEVPEQHLKMFLKLVHKYHQGSLYLYLHHSHYNYKPCDAILGQLKGAR